MYQCFIGKCPIHGGGCQRKSAITQTTHYGAVDPLAYLSAWCRLGGSVDRDSHCARNFKVPMNLVRDAVERIGESGQELLDEV